MDNNHFPAWGLGIKWALVLTGKGPGSLLDYHCQGPRHWLGLLRFQGQQANELRFEPDLALSPGKLER